MPDDRGMGLLGARLIVPAVWFGLLGALAFIETPLKFLAPGMTLDVALGVGRLVLTAADIAGLALLAVTTVLWLPRPRPRPAIRWVLGALWLVIAVQVAVIRPLLNARTDLVLAGAEPGQSPLHVVYIVGDVLLLALILVLLIMTARRRRRGVRRPA